MKTFFRCSVVQNNVKTSRHCYDELVEILVCMFSALCPPGDVIEVVNPFDIERNFLSTLHKGQAPAAVADPGKINDFAFIETQITLPDP